MSFALGLATPLHNSRGFISLQDAWTTGLTYFNNISSPEC